jgi:hypothetical protein
MKTKDFNSKITSSKLRENMNKMFGLNVAFEKYSREQLEDMRNKLRTRVFQQEGRAGINELLTNETYQKDKAMLDLLNTRIKEMLGEDIKKLRDKMVELSEAKKGVRAPKYTKKAAGTKDYDGDGKIEPAKDEVWGSRAKAAAKAGKPFSEAAKPDFLDADKDGNKKEPMKKAVKDKKANEGFPTVDDAKKAHAEKGTAGMKVGDKQKSSTGGEITKTATGLKHTAGKNYGGEDAPKTPDSDKKAKKTKESVVAEKDEGKHNNATTGFKALAKKAGGGEKGAKIAGAQRAKMKKAGQLEEANANYKHNVRFVNESLAFLLAEDEEGKAKAITAAGDMVNDYTSWMQRVGQYQTKTMIELADAIKADFGAAEAEAFKQAVGPALSATLEVLTQQREAVSNAVAVLAGEAAPEEPMGMEPSMDMPPEPSMDMSAPDEMNPAGDEFAGADAAAGGATDTGREMRESQFARRLAESHSIISRLAK